MIKFKWNKIDFSEEHQFGNVSDLKKYISAELSNWKKIEEDEIFSWKDGMSDGNEWFVIAGGNFVGISNQKF